MPPATPKITSIEFSDRFKKAYNKLDDSTKDRVDDTLRDLVKATIPPGRRLEKLRGHDGIWSARVSLHIRITFRLISGVAKLRNVGMHTEVYHRP